MAGGATVVIGGQDLTPFARVGRVRIDDVLNDAPNTAALTIVLAPRTGALQTGAFAPHAFDHGAFQTADTFPLLIPPAVNVGAPIEIYLVGVAERIFGGEITTREQYAEFDQPQHVRLDLTCIDYTRRLNRRIVVKEYGQASATAIVLDLIANFAPTIATTAVQAGLPTITGGITFTFEEVSRALSRIAEKIGAYWYVDYAATLHFFTGTESGPAPAPIVPGGRFADLKFTADLSQVRTRVIVEGDGATASLTLPAGDTIVPVSQTDPFNPAGGLAKIGPTRVAYTGIQAGGAKTNTTGPVTGGTPGLPGGPPPAPPTAPTTTVASAGTAGGLAGGAYYYGVTFELDDSRSAMGAISAGVSITAAANPPPTTAGLDSPPTKGPIAVGVAATYATTYVDAGGRETAATAGGTVLAAGGRPIDTPSGYSAAYIAPTGAMAVGYYDYAVTFLTPAGETLPSFQRAVNMPVVGSVRITLPWANAAAVVDGRIVGRRVYRSTVNPTTTTTLFPWHHVVDVPGNTPNQQFDDTMADAFLSTKNYPAFSTATDVGEAATVTLPVSADPRIVRRRLYRKDGAGEYRLVAQIPDNTATTFHDVVPGPGGDLAPTANQINTGAINVASIAIGPAGTVRRRLFRTAAGGSQYREVAAIGNNTTTTFLDTEPDSSLGGSPLPPQGTPGTSGTAGTVAPTPIGSATMQVDSLAGLPTAGWVAAESVLIRYAGTSSTGGFFLTGIPASGPGAVTAEIPDGTVVTTSPALTGVSPVAPVTLGDAVQLIAQVDDLAAQAAIAAVEGGDGIIEFYIQDRRLSEAGARARGLAELELFKRVETRLAYTTHDLETRSGRTVHVDLPAPTSITGDFLIQRVTIDDVAIAANVHPRRTVDASTTRFSFEDVLNRILLEQH